MYTGECIFFWKEHCKIRGQPHKKQQTDFHISVIKQLVTGSVLNTSANSTFTGECKRLFKRQFPSQIQVYLIMLEKMHSERLQRRLSCRKGIFPPAK